MKLFVIVEADHDGWNLRSNIHSTHLTKEEAIKELQNWHEEIMQWFNNPETDYKEGDTSFIIYDEEDTELRHAAHIEEFDI